MCYIQCTGFLWWVLRGGSGGVIRFMLALLIDVDEWVLCVKYEILSIVMYVMVLIMCYPLDMKRITMVMGHKFILITEKHNKIILHKL